jgi:hypothetical protein
VQLASYKFVAEQDTLRCTEIGLDPAKFSSYIKQHENFFNKKENREKLAAACSPPINVPPRASMLATGVASLVLALNVPFPLHYITPPFCLLRPLI